MKITSCILCKHSKLDESHSIFYENKRYNYTCCKKCTLTFQNPWPKKDLEKFYKDPKYWNSEKVYEINSIAKKIRNI